MPHAAVPLRRTGPRTWLRAVAGSFRLGLASFGAYRSALVLDFIALAFNLGVPLSLWLALYQGRPGLVVDGMSLRALFTYTLVSLAIQLLTGSNVTWTLREGIREGTIAMEFLRPVPVPVALLAQDFGNKVFALPMLALIGLVGVPLLRPLPPAAPQAFQFVLAVILAAVLVRVLMLLLGSLCFWTLEGRGLIGGSLFVIQFLSGSTLPLAFFPGVLGAVAAFLPFQGLINLPILFYLGHLGGTAGWQALARQAVWTAGVGLTAAWVWSRAVRKLVIQGG